MSNTCGCVCRGKLMVCVDTVGGCLCGCKDSVRVHPHIMHKASVMSVNAASKCAQH